MIEIADEGHMMTDVDDLHISMKSGVVNHDLINEAPKSVGELELMPQYSSEIVNYIIIQDAAKNITTGERTQYTSGLQVHGNLAFFPKA